MRAGGGKNKGSDFERVVCRELSIWLTGGQRTDLFTRNVLSGGRFTVMHGKGDAGNPGDIAAAHPMAYAFLEHFLIECKHYRSLKLDELLLKGMHRSFLGQICLKAEKQAALTHRHYLVIAKQNHSDAILLIGALAGEVFLRAAPSMRGLGLHYHLLHKGTVYIFTLSEVMGLVSPIALMEELECPK